MQQGILTMNNARTQWKMPKYKLKLPQWANRDAQTTTQSKNLKKYSWKRRTSTHFWKTPNFHNLGLNFCIILRGKIKRVLEAHTLKRFCRYLVWKWRGLNKIVIWVERGSRDLSEGSWNDLKNKSHLLQKNRKHTIFADYRIAS